MASNTLICGWYLALFALVFAGVVLVGFAVFVKTFKSPLSLKAKVMSLLAVTVAYALAMVTPAFQYTICKRALLA